MKSPLKITWKSEIVPLSAVLLSIAVSIASYSQLPEKVITHWNFYGQADGWSSRNFHVMFFPALLAAMYLLFSALPLIDPKKERYAEFSKVYNVFRNLLMAVMFAVFLIATLVNLGYDIDVSRTVSFLIGLMMIVMGNYMGKIKNNWFMDIRTPWTLSSEIVWQKTHRLGGVMFVLFGLILMVTPYLPANIALVLFLAGIFGVVVIPMVASYLFYRKEKGK